ncbi:MAG: Protocatechuate dioxygenase [Pseudonocardia sp.]|nr:Protocatechuate dioxygenase [Pseudonocardia sp.]
MHAHDRGLAYDVSQLVGRRRMLGLIAGAGLASLVGCSTQSGTSSTASATSAGAATGTAACGADIPEETAGPFPGDGSNGPNALTQSGIVRRDIRSSFGGASGTAGGVPLTINLTVQDRPKGCAPLVGAAVYLWHCTQDGRYSLYSQGVTGENYLRGVQEADSNGAVTFTSIFPAAYSGRWPHIHFEVYPSLASAAAQRGKITTSQLALPQDVCAAVYATDGYAGSVQNLARTSLASDMVFRDGYQSQLAAVSGSVSSGVVASLAVPVS